MNPQLLSALHEAPEADFASDNDDGSEKRLDGKFDSAGCGDDTSSQRVIAPLRCEMGNPDETFDFDVAFSFLADDEATACAIADQLRERMRVFIYSEQQKELAGRDGVETFTAIFEKRTRLCVVLYRDGWGQTKWTRVEETAIRNRGYEEGHDFLFVISLDGAKPPPWLPKTKIWLSYKRFGIDGAAIAIDARFQELGGEAHEESVPERAKRLARETQQREENQRFLESQKGIDAAHDEVDELVSLLETQVLEIGSPLTITRRKSGQWLVLGRRRRLLVIWNQAYSNSTRGSALYVKLQRPSDDIGDRVRDIFPSIEEAVYIFSIDSAGNYCWTDKDTGRSVSTKQLVKRWLKALVDSSYAADDDED